MSTVGFIQKIGNKLNLSRTELSNLKNNVIILEAKSNDEIFAFILNSNLTKFVIHCKGDVLQPLFELVKKKKLYDLIFVCTISTASENRNLAPKNFYFNLTSLDVLLLNVLGPINRSTTLSVVSSSQLPYYKQILSNYGKLITEIDVKDINNSQLIYVFLNTNDEYTRFKQVLSKSTYKNQLLLVEANDEQINMIKSMPQVSGIRNYSAGSSMTLNYVKHPLLKVGNCYVNGAVSITNTAKKWKYLIRNGFLDQGMTNFGVNIYSI